MKILKWVLIVIVIIAIAALAFLTYMGAFSNVVVKEKEIGPYTIVIERYVGDYKDCGKVFEKVSQALKNEGIEPAMGIGIYYDDPQTTPKEKWRSDLGMVLGAKDLGKVALLKKKKFNVVIIEKGKSMVAKFPLRNALSYAIGPAKGYPALMKHMKEKGYKMAVPYEIYDMAAGKILYIIEIIR